MIQYFRRNERGQFEPVMAAVTAGVRSLKCSLCNFEFMHLVPEELEIAHLAMDQHLHNEHKGNWMTVPVEVMNH